MKLFLAMGTLLLACAAHAAAQNDILPIEVYKPLGKGDGSKWMVSFTPVYLDVNRKLVTQKTVTFNVISGDCQSGATSIVPMSGNFDAKVTQKVCVGKQGDKTVIVGWLVAPGSEPQPFGGTSETEYGVGIRYVFNGDYLEAKQSLYEFKAVKQAD